MPELSITLPNGLNVKAELENFETNAMEKNKIQQFKPNWFSSNEFFYESSKRLSPTELCNSIGHLKGDEDSVITTTGCSNTKNIKPSPKNNARVMLTQKDILMHVSIISSNSSVAINFDVDKYGNMHVCESDGLEDRFVNEANLSPFTSKSRSLDDDDAYDSSYDDDEDYDDLEGEELSHLKDASFPRELTVTITYGFDQSVKEHFQNNSINEAGWEIELESWIRSIHTHMQGFYWHPSLKTRINLKVRYRNLYSKSYTH